MDDAHIRPLVDGYLAESLAAAKNEVFALKARAEGNPQAERLFTALAKAQTVHAKKILMLLRGRAASTVENMAEAASILDVLKEQYQAALPSLPDDGSAATGFVEQFRKTAMNHRALLTQMDEQKPAPYHVCTVCGFIHAGEIRGVCPVCQAVESKFESVE